MATLASPSQRVRPDTSVVSLTAAQFAIWQLGIPILDAAAVARHKRHAKVGMLWRAIRWQMLGMAALVGLMCLGRQWERVAFIAAAAAALAALFGWLVYAADLNWLTMDYSTYRSLHQVPPHVSAAADALITFGVAHRRIGVEYLKNDPILFVEDDGDGPGVEPGKVKRYDLIIW